MKYKTQLLLTFILIAIFIFTSSEIKESVEAATTHIIVIDYYRVVKDVNGNVCSITYLGYKTSSYNHGHSGGTVYHYGTSTNTVVVSGC